MHKKGGIAGNNVHATWKAKFILYVPCLACSRVSQLGWLNAGLFAFFRRLC